MPDLRLPAATDPLDFGRIVRFADDGVATDHAPVTLQGPEPTRHPEFLELAEYLLRRGLPVVVLTDGSSDEETITRIEELPAGDLRFVVDADDVPEPDRRLRFLRRMRDHSALRATISDADWKGSTITSLVGECDLERTTVHVGLASPPPQETSGIASELAALAAPLAERGIVLHVDATLPLDAFSDTELGALYRCQAQLP